MGIKDNTVSSENQMVNSSELSFLGNEQAKTRILVVGNSITRHGPCQEIGWNADWGMAASESEKDYVHRLYAKLTKNGQDVRMRIRQASYWETHFLEENILSKYEEERNFHADIVIFRLGENVINAKAENKPYFEQALEKFIDYIAPTAKKVVFTTCFWNYPDIDRAIQGVAQKRGDVCLNCNFSIDKTNMAGASFWHRGVAIHPSDKGMEAIADIIFQSIKK